MDALMTGFMYGLGATLGFIFAWVGFIVFSKLISPPKPSGGSDGVQS